ncbi:MAG: MgtC/SapB family protein [Anaerolineae bacterium]|nr:MgtC/SapB family protein [Anaerolineae bacterium]
MEREHARLEKEVKAFAGVRTFPLISLLGCAAALLSDRTGGLAFGIVLLLVGTLVAIAYAVAARQGHVGLTSEMAAVVVFVCGALAYWDHLELTAAIAVATFGFLTLKPQIHGLVRRISTEDMYATLKFAIISLIVLPVLPNQNYGPPPFDAFNPYRTWLMVVFISGISFLGYVLIKIVGPRRGIGLTGLLGGLASSTAVTLSFSERSQDHADLSRTFALAITLAWTVMFGRVLIEVAVLNRALLWYVWLPIVAAMGAGLLFSGVYYFRRQGDDDGDVTVANPFELGTAIKFGLLYAIILVVSKVAEYYFADTGVYVASIVAGVADVDAITLSMAQLSGADAGIALPTAARAIVLAAISNTVVKGGIALSVGSTGLRRALALPLAAMLVIAVVLAFFTF